MSKCAICEKEVKIDNPINYSYKKSNRIFFLDVLKVLALITMPIIHLISAISELSLMSNELSINMLNTHKNILYFFTPTIFLFCMGTALFLTTHNTPDEMIKRGKRLLLIGILLNLFRGNLPFSIAGSIVDSNYYKDAAGWVWGSDILFFDGLFFIVFGFCKKINVKDVIILIFAIALSILSSIFRFEKTEYYIIDIILGNFVYVTPQSFFPFVSWMIYPMLGYFFIKKFDKCNKKDTFMLKMGIISIILFFIFLALLILTGNYKERYMGWGAGEFIMDLPPEPVRKTGFL